MHSSSLKDFRNWPSWVGNSVSKSWRNLWLCRTILKVKGKLRSGFTLLWKAFRAR